MFILRVMSREIIRLLMDEQTVSVADTKKNRSELLGKVAYGK